MKLPLPQSCNQIDPGTRATIMPIRTTRFTNQQGQVHVISMVLSPSSIANGDNKHIGKATVSTGDKHGLGRHLTPR
jgi:hypothetical protein